MLEIYCIPRQLIMQKINKMFNDPQYLQVKGNWNSPEVWGTTILYSYVDRLGKKPKTGAAHRNIIPKP
jgi:hypothetical protein